ncbi:MAG: hypothetical protein WCD36_11935 [Rhodanobacteraceae bacterium]
MVFILQILPKPEKMKLRDQTYTTRKKTQMAAPWCRCERNGRNLQLQAATVGHGINQFGNPHAGLTSSVYRNENASAQHAPWRFFHGLNIAAKGRVSSIRHNHL